MGVDKETFSNSMNVNSEKGMKIMFIFPLTSVSFGIFLNACNKEATIKILERTASVKLKYSKPTKDNVVLV